jgi:hypothetical protein
MVKKSNAMRQFGGMVVGQEVRARTQLDIFGAQQRLSDEQIRSRIGFPRSSKMLTNPGLMEAKLIAEFKVCEIPLVARVEISFGWMRGHHEDSGFHTFSFQCVITRRGAEHRAGSTT